MLAQQVLQREQHVARALAAGANGARPAHGQEVHGGTGLFERASPLRRSPPERMVLPPPRALPPPSSLPLAASSLSVWASAASAGIANGSAPPPLAQPGRVLASTLLHGAPKAKRLSSHALF